MCAFRRARCSLPRPDFSPATGAWPSFGATVRCGCLVGQAALACLHCVDKPARLSPAAFDEYVPVTPVLVSRGHPYRMGARRDLPTAWRPDVRVSFITMISSDPYMLPAWPRSAMFVYANRRSKPDYYVCRLGGAYSHGKSNERRQKQFSHFRLLGYVQHGDGRSSGYRIFAFRYFFPPSRNSAPANLLC